MPAAPDLSPRQSLTVWGRNKQPRAMFAVRAYLTEEIRKSLVKAKDCARKAADQTDPKLKQEMLKLEEHWLSVARSHSKRISPDMGDLNLTFD
jgi:hypothetical protein